MDAEDELAGELACALEALRTRILARAMAEIDEPHVVLMVTPLERTPVMAQGPFPDGLAALAAAEAARHGEAAAGLDLLVLPIAAPLDA